MKIPIFPQDKANHFVYGAAIACIGTLLGPVVGATMCAVVAVGREVYNKIYGGHVSAADVGWTLMGGLTVLLPFLWR